MRGLFGVFGDGGSGSGRPRRKGARRRPRRALPARQRIAVAVAGLTAMAVALAGYWLAGAGGVPPASRPPSTVAGPAQEATPPVDPGSGGERTEPLPTATTAPAPAEPTTRPTSRPPARQTLRPTGSDGRPAPKSPRPPGEPEVRRGQPCSPEGAVAVTDSGTRLTCERSGGGRTRWH